MDEGIAPKRQQPEPRPQHHLVVMIALVVAAQPARFGHRAAEVALLFVYGLHGDRAILPDRRVEVQVLLSTYCLDLDLELLAYSFGTFEGEKPERVFAEGRVQRAHAFVLPQGTGHSLSSSKGQKLPQPPWLT